VFTVSQGAVRARVPPDLLADGRLPDVQPLGRPPEVPLFGDRDEVPKLPQLHDTRSIPA
jgi:hypothetical protein